MIRQPTTIQPEPPDARQQRMRYAMRGAAIVAVVMLLIGLATVIIAPPPTDWRNLLTIGQPFILSLIAIISLMIIRRGRITLGVSLLLASLQLGLLGQILLTRGFSTILSSGVIIVTVMLALSGLPRRPARFFIGTGIVSGILIVVLDRVGPADRFTSPAGLQQALTALALTLIAALALLAARQQHSRSLRNRLLIPTLMFFSVVLFTLIALNTFNTLQITEGEEDAALVTLQRVFTERLNSLKAIAVGLALQVAEREDVQAAFAAKDRAKLIELTLPIYLNLERQVGLPQFQFHLPPAISFLRLHQLDRFGDDLSSFRFTVLEANRQQSIVSGLEIGRAGLGMRGVVPVKFQGQHIGTVEMGIDVEARLISSLKDEFNVDWQIWLRRGPAEIATFQSISTTLAPLEDLVLQTGTLPQPIFGESDRYQAVLNGEPLVISRPRGGNHEYAVASAPLKDFSGAIIGVVDVVVDRDAVLELIESRLTLATMLALGSLIGVAVGLTALTTRVLQPLNTLTDAARAVSGGDLSRTITIATQDELGVLAETFNNMTGQLRMLIGSLERQVENRTAQLQASAEVGRAAVSILNPDDLLRASVDLITTRFDFYYAAVFTLDETGHWAVLREATGEAGRILKEHQHRLEVGGQSMVGFVTANRQPRVALDVGRDAVRFANPLLPDTRSEVALPLIVGQRVLGALDVQSRQPAAFDEASVATLQNMADQIAIALFNAMQFSRAEAQALAQRTLLDAALDLTGQADRATLLEKVGRYARRLTQADGINVYLPVNEDEIELVYSDDPIGRDYIGQRLRKGEGLSGRVMASGRPQRVDDYATWAERAAADTTAGFHAVLAVPMIWRGRAMGVLTLTHSQPDRLFSADDENLIQLLAAQTAAALANADLAEQQRNTLEELHLINRRLTGEAWAGLLAQLPDDMRRVQYARHDLPVPDEVPPDVVLAAVEGQTVQWRKTDADATPLQSGLATPIVLRGEVIGALGVEDTRADRVWSEADRTLIRAVADEVAIAIDNARLIDQTERRAYRERLIADITRKMLAAGDLESIAQVAGQEIARALRLDRAQVQIGAPPDRPNGHSRHTGEETAA